MTPAELLTLADRPPPPVIPGQVAVDDPRPVVPAGPPEPLFDLDQIVTHPCARCHHEQATTRVHTSPDLQARDTWPYAVTGPATVTSPPLHTGADSAPMCGSCAAWLAAAWRSRHHTPCGATYDLWHVWTTPLAP